MENPSSKIQPVLLRASITLSRLLSDLVEKEIETLRVARLAYLLLSSNTVLPKAIIDRVSSLLLARQYEDGGWADIVDTIWAGAFFHSVGELAHYERAKNYIVAACHSNGAWGKSQRDMTRIPVTGLVGLLMPDIISDKTRKWLQMEWLREWEGTETSISANYKAAYVIFGIGLEHEMTKNILDWLIKQTEPDGGWGPWRGHPIGSQVLYTALSLRCMAYCEAILDKSAQQTWLSGRNYLLSKATLYGLWPSHHIDEGSGWAFHALSQNQFGD